MKAKRSGKALAVVLAACMALAAVPFTASAATGAGSVKPIVATGTDVSVALDTNGKVYAWGYNHYGSLGDNTQVQSNVPKQVVLSGLGDMVITQLSAGQETVAAVTSDGALYTWGVNEHGELGNGDDTYSFWWFPVKVEALADKVVTKASAGTLCMAAVTADGEVYTWGFNSYGQLGIGTPSSTDEIKRVPQKVTLPAGVKAVDVSIMNEHAAVLTEDGQIYTWGYNGRGQLGDGTTTKNPTPQKVEALAGKTIVSVSVGNVHSVALTDDGDVYLWGGNSNGQLGNGTNDNVLTPTKLEIGGAKFSAAVAGGSHTALLTTDGKVYTFGWNSSGQLGNGKNSNANNSNVPILVGGLLEGQEIIGIAAGYGTTMAWTADGSVFGWGDNWHGQVGNGVTNQTSCKLPAQVVGVGGEGTLELGVYSSGDHRDASVTAKAAIPEPAYTVTIPTKIDAGELTQKAADDPDRIKSTEFAVSATEIKNLFGEKEIAVSISTPDGAFELADSENKLAYSVFNRIEGGTALKNNDKIGTFYYASSGLSQILRGRIEIDQSAITRAGDYSGTVTFTIAVEQIQK